MEKQLPCSRSTSHSVYVGYKETTIRVFLKKGYRPENKACENSNPQEYSKYFED